MSGGVLKQVQKPLFILLFLWFSTACIKGDGDNVLSASSVNFIPFTVLSTSPADGAVSIASEATISLSFSEPIDFSTLTVNSNTAQCMGSVQVSNNNFASCIHILPTINAFGNNTAILTPTSVLVAGQTYKLRTSALIKSIAGKAIKSAYSHVFGFGVSGDNDMPTIQSVSPTDDANEVVPSISINITFSEPMDAGSIDTNTENTVCSGALQVTSDSFSNCVKMASSPIPSSGARTFTIIPASDLAPGATYKFKIAGTIRDQYVPTSGPFKTITERTNSFTVAKARTIKLTWAKSPATAVNKAGGGYRVYYSMTQNFNIDTVTSINVPYISGASAPTEKVITIYKKGIWYFKIKAYSLTNLIGSDTSAEVSMNVE